MILMSVGDDKTFDLVDVVFKVGHIRDNKVDSEHVIRWECKTAVHNYNGIFIFKGGDIHTNLLQTA